LLFHFLGCTPGPLRDDLDIVVGYVRVGFYGKVMKRYRTPDQQQGGERDNQYAIIEGEINEAADHAAWNPNILLAPSLSDPEKSFGSAEIFRLMGVF
jgi:hypothetical protein